MIQVSDPVVRTVLEQAHRTFPSECCGLLSGANGTITRAHPLRNEAENPRTTFFAAPSDLFAAMREIRDSGNHLLGIYHSHPRSKAYPSPTDVEMAFYPEAVYFIISLEPREELRAFKINGSVIEPVEIEIVGQSGHHT